jgi:hypothetical protein
MKPTAGDVVKFSLLSCQPYLLSQAQCWLLGFLGGHLHMLLGAVCGERRKSLQACPGQVPASSGAGINSIALLLRVDFVSLPLSVDYAL